MFRKVLFVLLLLVPCGRMSLSQVTTATLSGIVKDDSGAVLPGVSVTVRNLETGLTRTSITKDDGRFSAPNLPLGDTEVEASLPGFRTAVRRGISLTVGRDTVIDLILNVGEITEKVTVTGEAPLVETTQAALSDLVDQKQIRDLPLNGRSFTDLALLQAGAMQRSGISSRFNPISGGGARISIGGARPKQNVYLLDGQSAKDALGNTPGSAAGTVLGVETVREFSVLVNTYSAEYGGAGGVINAVTKSGTNRFHGALFYFLRNDNLDARNFFDRSKPEFKRNQYGFTIEGPLVKDRTFFFGSYEALIERLGSTNLAVVPTVAARQGVLPTATVSVHSSVKPFLNLYPLPNGRDFGDGTAEYVWAGSEPTDEHYFLVKVDHKISASDSLESRYMFDDADQVRFVGLYPQFKNAAQTRRQLLSVSWNRIFSSALINSARFSFNRSLGGLPNLDPGLDPSLSFVPGRFFGQITAPPLSGLGTNAAGGGDYLSILNLFEFGDTVVYTRGSQTIKFGGMMRRTQLNGLSGSQRHGTYVFPNLRAFLENQPTQFQFVGPGTGNLRGFRQSLFAFFVQDDFRVASNFTLNLGLRYEFQTVPVEVAGRISTVRDPVRDTVPLVGNPFWENPSLKSLGPRIGFAWDPRRTGRTSIRSGFGLFHQQLDQSNWWISAFQTAPFFDRLIQSPTVFPNGYSVFQSSTARVLPTMSPMQFDLATPYMMQYHLTIQQQLLSDAVMTVSYVGAQGRHLGRLKNSNINQFQVFPDGRKFFPMGAARTNPNFGDIEMRAWDTNSVYHAFQLQVEKRFSHGFQAQGSYAFSKNMDQASGIAGGDVGGAGAHSQDPFDKRSSWGLSGWHVQNRFSANFTLDIPAGDLTGAPRLLLKDWKISGLIQIADGNPVNIINSATLDRVRTGNSRGQDERPDLRPGAPNNPVLGGPDRYWDASSFVLQPAGFFGNLGRNTAVGPGLASVDFSVAKNFNLGAEERGLQFRAEFFNILYRANVSNPNATVFTSANGVPSGSFGRISTTTTAARQVQLGLKLLF